jgi:hypothetical protein
MKFTWWFPGSGADHCKQDKEKGLIIDSDKVGIPIKVKGCKLILTTRS